MKKLRDVEAPLANFFASGPLALGGKLGPVLWQFPRGFALDLPRFERFLALLPRDTAAAARLAKRHDHRLAGRAFTRALVRQPIRHALEVRHESFRDPAFAELLRAHGAALAVSDAGPHWPRFERQTADFMYVRLHGAEELYASGYTDAALAGWARKLRRWARAGDVYVYFDNDAKVRAPVDAARLIALLNRRARRSP